MKVNEIIRAVFKVTFSLLIALIVMVSHIDAGFKRYNPNSYKHFESDDVTITNEQIFGISAGDFNLNLYLPVIHIAT